MPSVKIDDERDPTERRGPFGRNLPLARAVRAAVRATDFSAPVIGAGGIASPWQAEQALEAGDCDFVASARQSLADPDWWEKIRAGEGAEVRRCLFTNYCEALDQGHKEVTCQRWDREALTPVEPRTADGRRRLTAPRWSGARERGSG